MKYLILSCNTGEGHNAAGRAVYEVLKEAGEDCLFLDMLSLIGPKASRRVSQTYVKITTKAPRVFEALYKAGQWISSPKHKSPVYWVNQLYKQKVLNFLLKEKIDVVITPHLFPAQTLTALKERGKRPFHSVAIATDYACIPFWEETNCDYYVVPHPDLVEEFAAKGLPRKKLLPYGIPVSPAFQTKLSKEEARKKLGLPVKGTLYLIMSGSMGYGKLGHLARELFNQDPDGRVLIICGNNQELQEKLHKQFFKEHRITVIGFTKQVSTYMDACDVLLTKPGGLTSTEAAVKEVPLVHTAPIPGCESHNLAFFLKKGMSVSGKDEKEQAKKAVELAQNFSKQLVMEAAQNSQISKDAAQKIYVLTQSTFGKKETNGLQKEEK